MKAFLPLAPFLALTLACHAGIPDFAHWLKSGTAFTKSPATGDLIPKLEILDAPDGPVASSEIDGDAPRGALTSPVFTIDRNFLAFSLCGGDYERHCCMNLLVDGKIVRSATGRNHERLTPASWDVSAWKGKEARLEIVDQASGRWGHLNVAAISLTDTPAVAPVVTTPLYQEPLRPVFHFTARQWTMDRLNPGMRQEGWINDLNGMIYYEGEYHMFAQRWNKCWLHAVSRDLVHWEEREPAFWEQKLDIGVQSGHCVIDYKNTSGLGEPGGEPPMVAFWSHNDNRSHGLTYSLDRGHTWRDYPDNPLFQFPERDPKVFRHEPSGKWVMLLYGSNKYHIFTSDNLLDWNNENSAIPDAFECPDFFELPVTGEPEVRKWVLVHADGKYAVGSFDGVKFTEETERRLGDIGGEGFYASQTFENSQTGDGRRIQMAWIRGGKNVFPDMPFSQQISFPCELTLHRSPNGLRLHRKPVPEIAKLEQEPKTWPRLDLRADAPLTLTTTGDAYRLEATVSAIPPGGSLVFHIRGSEVRLTQRSVEVKDTQPAVKATLSTDVTKLELLIDRRSLEIFVNDGEVSCTRNLIPSGNDISVKTEGAAAVIDSLRLTPLKSMWATAATATAK